MEPAGAAYVGHPPLIVRARPVFELSDEEFFEFCRINRDLRIERNSHGEFIVTPPTGGRTSEQNAEILARPWAATKGRRNPQPRGRSEDRDSIEPAAQTIDRRP
jgi:Uma2 family endonuclease